MGASMEDRIDQERASGPRPIVHGQALPSQTIADCGGPEIDLSTPSFTEGLSKDLQMIGNLLRWADHCLAMPIDPSGDLEGMRARARFVLAEARELVTKCRDEVDAARALATIR